VKNQTECYLPKDLTKSTEDYMCAFKARE